MKRKLLCGLLAALVLTCVSAKAAPCRVVPVQVDGTVLSQGVNYLESGGAYGPLRGLLTAFRGWAAWWDSSRKVAAASSGSQSVTADPAGNTVTVNGRTYSGKVFVERGRTYIPLRTLVTALGGGVAWDPHLGGAAVTSPGADHNAMDLYWLSRIISAESRGEDMTGQIAVGNVVLNRVKSAEFPNTIPSVIFDRKHDVQFTPVSNGTVYLPPTAQSIQAAKRALNGENTAGKALYFYAPALSQGTWINANRTYLKTIGCHRFYL